MSPHALWAGIFVLCFASAEAVNYYVSPLGSDGNSGILAKPFGTITKGAGLARAGDTVFVMNGTYTYPITMQYSGQENRPIVLMAYPGHSPVIRLPDGNQVNGIYFSAPYINGVAQPIGWIVFQGFEIANAKSSGIKFGNAHDLVIRGNYVHNNRGNGILGSGGLRVLIDGNIVTDNGTPCLDYPATCTRGIGHGMYIGGGYITIINNLVYANQAYGIQVAGYPYDCRQYTVNTPGDGCSYYRSNDYASPEYAGASHFLIANNTFAFQLWRSGIVVWQEAANNNRIENNIFHENAQLLSSGEVQGIEFYYCGAGNTVKNNLFYASNAGGSVAIADTRGGASYTQSGNIVNVSNPKFVNGPATLSPTPNFALQSGSPAIDAGTNLFVEGVSRDFAGISRPQGPAFDIGAFECAGGSFINSLRASYSSGSGGISIRPFGFGGIAIDWKGQAKARAIVYSLDGERMATFNNVSGQGVVWNPVKSSAGVYLVQMQSGGDVRTAKIYCGR